MTYQERLVLTALDGDNPSVRAFIRVETVVHGQGKLGLDETVSISVIVPKSESLVEVQASALKRAMKSLERYERLLGELDTQDPLSAASES